MAFWLADQREGQASDWIQRFDPRFWTVNFPAPNGRIRYHDGHDGFRVDANFLRKQDLAGLIWESVDRHRPPAARLSHPAATTRAASLRSAGTRPGSFRSTLPNGPTFTIEGRDESGAPRTWYVRLVELCYRFARKRADRRFDFSDLKGGWDIAVERRSGLAR